MPKFDKTAATLQKRGKHCQSIEREVRHLHNQGEFENSVVMALELYREEFLGWLVRRTGSFQHASDIYSDFLMEIWRQWPGFRWEASFRTWAYCILRRLCAEAARSRQESIPLPSRMSRLNLSVKKSLSTYKLTEVERNFHLLSEEILDQEQRDILTLRIGAAMSWDDVARIITNGKELDDAEMKRQVANLRQRFKRIKTTLRQEALKRGMVRGQDPISPDHV